GRRWRTRRERRWTSRRWESTSRQRGGGGPPCGAWHLPHFRGTPAGTGGAPGDRRTLRGTQFGCPGAAALQAPAAAELDRDGVLHGRHPGARIGDPGDQALHRPRRLGRTSTGLRHRRFVIRKIVCSLVARQVKPGAVEVDRQVGRGDRAGAGKTAVGGGLGTLARLAHTRPLKQAPYRYAWRGETLYSSYRLRPRARGAPDAPGSRGRPPPRASRPAGPARWRAHTPRTSRTRRGPGAPGPASAG